ncbi:FAD-dependent monooxygenase [Actinoallomurus sp. NPDC052274]|uniref:FAD-dependent oxidoreductase n=1 Tax=Actinoallomurus sp. NPDC052274 TaxID=3155420 RepID=UPI003429CF0C
MNEERTPVLIVGGSLVGLSAALFLSWHGIRSVLVERNTGLSPHPRARGVNARTMELYRQVGIEDRMRSTGSALALRANEGIIAAESLAGREYGALEEAYNSDPVANGRWRSPTDWCLCHQHEVEPILRERAAELGADLRFGTELTEFDQDADGVWAEVRDADGVRRRIRADYLIAADGAGGRIRDALGIGADGPGTLGHFVNVRFRADLREPLRGRRFVMCYTISGPARCGLLPVDNAEEWLLHVPFEPGASPEFTADRCVALVRAAAGVPDVEVTIEGVAPWESAGRTARRYAHGRVFLVGDAAHVMPPSGAFGSNTGVQDAHNLAWKLALVLSGRAGPGLLDTYDEERRPAGAATVEQAVLRSKDRPRIAGGPSVPPDPAIRPDTVVAFGQRYRSAAVDPGLPADADPWEPGPSGLPGTRAPHVDVRVNGRSASTIDLYGRNFVLLTGPYDGAWAEAFASAAERIGVGLDVHRAGHEVVAVDEDLCEAHGIGSSGALLVRPDGFIAWRSAEAPLTVSVDSAARVFARLLATEAPTTRDVGPVRGLIVR